MASISKLATGIEKPDEEQSIRLIGSNAVLLPSDATSGRVVPMVHANSESGVDFGAEVYGIDLNKLSTADFDLISDALHKHKLLVFKEQPEMLTPQQQYLLTSRCVNGTISCAS